MDLHLQPDWQRTLGQHIQIWIRGEYIRKGIVDAVMPDNSLIWISGDGPFQRQIFARDEGYQIFAHFPPTVHAKCAAEL
ncbi:UNVERIFIED_ORG: hypothetical protein ABIB19_003838 [Arthrobacter sp. UYEF10]